MYNILGEITVAILSSIMMINFITSFTLKERRHKIFLLCILAIVSSTMVNIWSTRIISSYSEEKYPLAMFVTTLYFILLCSPTMMFAIYVYDFVSVEKRHKKQLYSILCIPYFVYLVFIVLNIKTGWVFSYDKTLGYVRGPLKYVTYITTSVYVLIGMIIVLYNRKSLSKRIFIVFCAYPVITLGIIFIQFLMPYMIMTGATAMAPMLLTYLTIQTDLLDYDLTTGLMTEKHLMNLVNHTKNTDMVFILIENYDSFYETIGYKETNFLLLKIAQRISATFPKHAFHISADRFAVTGTNMEKMRDSVLKICDEFKNFKTEEGRIYRIETRCIGLNVPGNARNYNNAMELASEMFNSIQKHKDRDKKELRFQLCGEVYEEKVRRTNIIKEILDRELNVDSEMYQVFFQPIYSVSKEKYVYSEALSRLLDTEIGEITPDEFIAVAETKGLIEKLGNVAFEKICKFISQNPDTIKAVSVNFSVSQLSNPYIVENVLATIKKYNIKPENIIMEITESIFIDDFEVIKERMERLSAAGIVFYLDDFGTGYSNFANVVELPFSTIKFDRSMVLSMESKEESRRLIFSLISAFKQNGMTILMEGVENLTQDMLVREAGADLIQGFLYKRPLCEKDCIELFSR